MQNIIKKNILDLQYQKYLMIASASLIVSFTYLIGVSISFITKQIRLDNLVDMVILVIFSSAILGICVIIFLRAFFHMENIILILKEI